MQTTHTAKLPPTAAAGRRGRARRLTHLQLRNLWGFAFAIPALCLFALFSIYPIARTLYLSFFDYSVVEPPRPVGFNNYRNILSDPRFHDSLFNSIRY
ncbi:MAG: sugar transporter permease, partial [Thermomicrobiales bacterium]|nr:sugar transporter permease [Thermomicrobiales bacterium]